MPHLSPMSWLAALLLFWAACSMLASSTWWNSTSSFMTSDISHTSAHNTQWTWLQDGWV